MHYRFEDGIHFYVIVFCSYNWSQILKQIRESHIRYICPSAYVLPQYFCLFKLVKHAGV